MADLATDDQPTVSDYEALVEFLYLAPVGIIKFRPDGIIQMANPTAAQLLMPLAADGDMSDIYRLLADLAPDLRRHVERYTEPAGQIFDQMQLVVPITHSTLMLDINKINDTTMMAVVQNITDLTEARREVVRRTESQRLLAAVFMRLTMAVVVNRADGFILLSNAAFQKLMGYDAKSLTGLNIDALLPPECTSIARAARAQQRLNGGSYETDITVVARDGTRTPVIMHSSILLESDNRQLRVITLVPNTISRQFADQNGGVTQVRSLDLARFRAAIGTDWPYIESRALSLVEEAIRPLLDPADILKRGSNDTFVIWFANGNPARNTAVLTLAAEAVRRVFVTEFGTRVAERVIAAMTA